MRLVVTGAGGGLGRAFLSLVPAHHEVTAFTHAQLDIGDHGSVREGIASAEPDAILNFAAMTAVDACESDEEAAFRANAVGVQNLALAARDRGAVLLTVSTDYVFDGNKGSAYDESDPPNPLSVYARSKLEGERFARGLLDRCFVVRTGFVFGGGSDFLSGATSRLEAGETVGGLADRIGSPTYVRHLAARILPLVATGRYGTYHLAGPEPTTWFDVLGRLKAMGGLPGTPTEQTAEQLALPAPRPRDSSLRSVYAGQVGIDAFPPLDQALKEFLDAR